VARRAMMGMAAPSQTAPKSFERGIPDFLRFVKIQNQFQARDAQFFGKFNSGVNQTEIVGFATVKGPTVERMEVLACSSVS
jgi:hypothetical protein